MTNEEAVAFLKSLPKEAIREVLAESTSRPKKHKIILKGLVTYHNKCLLCDNEWERTEEISFTLTRTSKPGALIRREFTWCGKCSINLLGFTKEEIIKRAIKIAVKVTIPVKEARSYGEYSYNEVLLKRDCESRGEEDELLEEPTTKMYKGRTDEEEVRSLPIEELEISKREVGRTNIGFNLQQKCYVALLGWEGGMSI